MRKFWMLLPVAAIGLALAVVNAQPPQGGKGRDPQAGQPVPARRGAEGGERKPDAQVEAWMKTLAEKITDPHDEIRDSARAGLVAVGKPALATLRQLANGDDGAKVTAATKLIDAIENGQRMQAMMMGGMGVMQPMAGGAGGISRGGANATPGSAQPRGNTPNARPEGNQPRGDRPPGPGPGGPGNNPFEAILDDLGLNDKQRKQCDEIHEALRTKMQEVMEQARDGKLERDDARAKRREIHETMMKEMKEVLTEEQFTKFEEGMKKLGPPPRPDRE
jgi:Spy/CpxP family protein refolding chaperone